MNFAFFLCLFFVLVIRFGSIIIFVGHICINVAYGIQVKLQAWNSKNRPLVSNVSCTRFNINWMLNVCNIECIRSPRKWKVKWHLNMLVISKWVVIWFWIDTLILYIEKYVEINVFISVLEYIHLFRRFMLWEMEII